MNLFGWLGLVAGALAMAWLFRRAWRSKNLVVKWGGAVISGLLVTVFALVSILVLIGLYKAYAKEPGTAPVLEVEITPERVQRGESIAVTFCASCHSVTRDLPLTGGLDLADDLPINLGSFVSVNLTPAGPLSGWTDGEIFRAIRDGIGHDNRKLFIMSTINGRNLSDEDINAVIAYLRDTEGVPNETLDPPDQANLLALAMTGAGMIPEADDPTGKPIAAPPLGATVEYGEYILSYQDCRVCHGEDLKGGVEGQLAPIGWNLDLVKGWTQEEFITTMRSGVDPKGYEMSASMPWRNVGRMSDDELAAIYLYLVNMP